MALTPVENCSEKVAAQRAKFPMRTSRFGWLRSEMTEPAGNLGDFISSRSLYSGERSLDEPAVVAPALQQEFPE
jgi:hypothetical protein